jgi:hypothetical protein
MAGVRHFYGTDPDPRGPKTYKPYGSGSGTLNPVFFVFVFADPSLGYYSINY